MDGRVLTEMLDPALAPPPAPADGRPPTPRVEEPVPVAYTEEEDAAIQQRLADLGYL